jgi:hypothetical protein
MTEREWQTSDDWSAMLRTVSGSTSERKWRLFAIACCHCSPRLLDKDRWPELEIATRFADGLATQEELAGANQRACSRAVSLYESNIHPDRAYYFSEASAVAAAVAVATSPSDMCDNAHDAAWKICHAADDSVEVRLCNLLRDIVVNPFFELPTIRQAWLSWNGDTVAALAQVIYQQEAFDRLPILADALEDAGCDHREILDHCRAPTPHVRGCWLLDLLLGKE